MDQSQYPQPLWERAVALLKSNGSPITAQSIQAAMNTLAGDPDPASGSSVDDVIDRTMQTAPNPPRVDATVLADPKSFPGYGMDNVAKDNLYAEVRGQGPAKLNSQDASAPDARNGANTTSDTSNHTPGTQDAPTSASAPYWNAPVAPNGMPTELSGISGDGAMKGGMLAALMATLSKRYKPSMGQSIHLGNVHAPQAASLYEGVITQATPQEMAKAKSKPQTNVRSRTAKRRKKDDEE